MTTRVASVRLAKTRERTMISSTHGLETGPPIAVRPFGSDSLTISQLFVPLLMALNIKNSSAIGVCSRSSNALALGSSVWQGLVSAGRGG